MLTDSGCPKVAYVSTLGWSGGVGNGHHAPSIPQGIRPPTTMNRHGRSYVEAALRNRSFSLVYQPIIHLDSGTISGVEALCRFHDGRPPDVWFNQCAALGLAGAMDLAVIDVALRDLDRLPDGYLALNLSTATLATPGPLRDLLRPALARRPIVLELTEHAVVEDYDRAADALRILRDAGILLAVDDAGAGYASFRHILRLRPDIIKLDRSITQCVDEDHGKRALASALVIFAAEMNASVVAEGIETEAELTALRLAGVERGQGFWLARPGPLPVGVTDYRPRPFVDLVGSTSPPFGVDLDVLADLGDIQDATTSVVAHDVLTSMASIETAIALLSAGDGDLSREEHRALCGVLQRQAGHVTEILTDLVRGLPPGTTQGPRAL